MISEAVIKRLPRYYRHIKQLADSGVTRVSSNKIASVLNITASQVRQDLCNFGGFGQQGYGYDVVKLKNELAAILGLDKEYDVINQKAIDFIKKYSSRLFGLACGKVPMIE